ncbi:MAG: GNAT family N-acetyltransferase [Catenulispora sp.]|nr:GNAT family N-acetyltransferase [Catenulispora sp.]
MAVTIRPLVDSDLDAVLPLLVRDAASMVTAEAYLEKSADHQYRPEWTWLAVDEASREVLAVAVWWGSPAEQAPGALDAVLVRESVPQADRVGLAGQVLRAGHESFTAGAAEPGRRPPEYHVFVPGDWRERPEAVAALEWRIEAVALAGLTERLERLRFEWTPKAGIPEASDRLTFHAEDDDEVFVDLLARVLEGSLDHTSVTEAAAVGARAQARSDVEFYQEVMLGERSWWRVAKDAAGATVGFGLPSRNPGAYVVGYLGVLPEHRGKGYSGDILDEIVRILALEAGADSIRSDTDLANRPMAAAMERSGFVNFARRLVFSAP